MNGFVAAGRPASSLLNVPEARVVDAAYHDGIIAVFGEMALQTEIAIANGQHFVVHTAMGIVTGRAAFPHRLMLESKGTRLGRVAFRAGATLRSKDTFREQLLFIVTMGIMAIDAGNAALSNRMAVWQGKLALDIHVTLQAGGRAVSRIVNQVPSSTFHGMQAARSVAGLASVLHASLVINDEAGMYRVLHSPPDRIVAEAAVFATNKLRSGSLGNRKHRPVY